MSVNGLRPYPAYRDFGLGWLGTVPDHWRLVRAKWLFTKMDRPVRPNDEVVTCFRDGTVTLRKNRRELGFTESAKEIGYQGVRRGDLVIHAMDAFAGACGVSDSDGKSTPVYAVCTPKDERVSPRYYASCVREMARSRWIMALSRGIRERSTDFRFAAFGNQLVPVPPSREQRAIASFLEAADRRIRRYIRAKERLVELLEERKQALIHEAVTGRIDVRTGQPYPAYKDSGVEWLGKVPEHWEVFPLKYRARCSSGDQIAVGDVVDAPCSEMGRVPVIGGNGRMGYAAAANVFSPTIAVGRVGALCGNVHLVEPPAWITDNALVLQVDPRALELRYVAKTLGVRDLNELANQSAQPLITGTQVRNQQLPFPPLLEQASIVTFLNDVLEAMQRATSQAAGQITLLREYRTRLIADVVTGKLDVREAAARLPETDPLPRNRDRADPIPTESSLHSTVHHMAKEASA